MTLAPPPPMGPATLSDNTQAVLLLTSPLLASGGEAPAKAKVLTAREYGQLAQSLLQARHQPADLLNGSGETVLASTTTDLDPDRLNLLLSRGFQLGQALEHWANRSITVIGRADEVYPKRYKQRLRHQAPPLLYACGNLELLHRPALAVMGSRSTPESLLQETTQIGALAAAGEVVIASGAAKGVDEAAMLGALQAGGAAIGVVADSLEKMAAKPIWRQALIDGRLLLLSAEAPSARFQVWRAMARNKLIYALADAALVVSSAKGEGGTWAGATEQLQTLQFCPVHVLGDPRGGPGLAALAELGARSWPDPASAEALQALLRHAEQLPVPAVVAADQVQQGSLLESIPPQPQQPSLSPCDATTNPASVAAVKEAAPVKEAVQVSAPEQPQAQSPAVALAAFIDELLLSCLHEPHSIDELAVILDVSKTEVRRWCLRLVEQGKARKLSKPVRYVCQQLPD